MSRTLACPRCGFLNRESRRFCELCQTPFGASAGATDGASAGASAASLPPGTKGVPPAGSRTRSLPESPSGLLKPGSRRDFFEEIRSNTRKSYLLMLLFLLLAAGVGFAIGWVEGGMSPMGGVAGLLIAALVSGVYLLLAYYRGGSMLIAASSAHEILHESQEERQLQNIVEEMSIASGLPPPRLFIMETMSPNAFATGRDPDHAAVVVTRGLLVKLNRDELQGVVAHEMAHIASYDVRYMMLAAVLLGMIVLLSDFFRRSLWFGGSGGGRSRRGGKGGNVLLLLLAILFILLAPLFARLLVMAVSRRRELLADARAVEFTRNPKGLSDALLKISTDTTPAPKVNRATQHLYIVNPVREFSLSASSLFSTHPPTETRLRLLKEMGA